jgi:hypothetical protein
MHMSEIQTAQNTELHDRLTPRTFHNDLTAAQFKEYFAESEGPILNVGAGDTALRSNLGYMKINKQVVSLDPSYKHVEENDFFQGTKVPGLVQEIPNEDETFATTVAHFVMQHIPTNQGIADGIREMVRVTKPVEDIHDNRTGTVLIGPVFDVPKLTDLIHANGLENVCGIRKPDDNVRDKAALPFLIIKKVPALTNSGTDRIDQLATTVAESGALRTMRTLHERASRMLGGLSFK